MTNWRPLQVAMAAHILRVGRKANRTVDHEVGLAASPAASRVADLAAGPTAAPTAARTVIPTEASRSVCEP